MKLSGNYNRIQLPQLYFENIEDFRRRLEQFGINSVKARVEIRSIKPLQNEIDTNKIHNIVNSDFVDTLRNRIFVLTNNLQLIDGHHSLHALCMLESSLFKVNCIILNDSYENLAIKLQASTLMKKINEEESKPKTDTDRLKDRQAAEMEALKKKHFNELQSAKQKEFNKKMDESRKLTPDKLFELWLKTTEF